ncbi:hypothetical protein [Mycobacterium sp. 1245852.3]|uniref:hypothetical protein n=1 Tax=Mycobacterium sp. 1245852.3 TaxID=1856860 RepID=UPI0018D33D12|nr:hypothetical protein [Mycobacterium sp. 1245852.3]
MVNRKPEKLLKSIHRTHELIISAAYDIVGFPDHGIHSAIFAFYDAVPGAAIVIPWASAASLRRLS